MNIQDKLKNTIEGYRLIKRGELVVVGVSGGADSVCLLYLLNSLKGKLRTGLHIAHLDHALRKDSKKDAAFVKRLAERLGISFSSTRIDVKKLRGKFSLEEKARDIRLEYLLKVANRIKAKKIALAHNFDDQAETILMRILRGTGLYGLSGIPIKRRMGNVYIIRPLLMIKRREIEAFLKRKKIEFCTDKTNRNEAYFRNKIRHDLLPGLEKGYNKNIKEALFNLGQSAGYDYDYLRQAAARFLCRSKTKLNLKSLIKLHTSVLRFKLREAITCLQGDTRRITFKHIQELEDLIFNRPQQSVVDLPKGLSVKKEQKTLVFYIR